MNARLTLLCTGLLLTAGPVAAADWPQWRGPNRDGHAKDTGLLKSFPAGGPKLLWSFENAGLGYSAPAIVGGKVYCLGDDPRDEVAYALDLTTGKQLWRTPFGSVFSENHGNGPRCTPTVDGDTLYVLGPKGDLACLGTADGKVCWKTNLLSNLNGVRMTWDYAESPLVDGDQVVCSPGGDHGTLAALDKKTGQLRWRSKGLSANATYSSMIVAELAGVRQYVQMTMDGVAGFAPKDGKLLWVQNVAVNTVATIPTPIAHDNCVYVTSDYGAGCGLVKLTPDGSGGVKSEVAYTNRSMDNHTGGVIRVGDHVYGSSGNVNNTQQLPLVCQDFKTGKVAWQHSMEPSALVYADGHLYCYGQNTGTLVRVEASPKGFVEKGRFTLPKQSSRHEAEGAFWAHPVIADGKLFLRDQDLLFCFDLRQ